jgi:hypothetical protein
MKGQAPTFGASIENKESKTSIFDIAGLAPISSPFKNQKQI